VPLKTFEGPNVGGLLAQIRAELGPDAVIIDVAQRPRGVALTAADAETARTVRPRREPMAPTRRPPAVASPAPAPAPVASPAAASAPNPSLDRAPGRPGLSDAVMRIPAPTDAGSQIVLAFVGPTGAGKTTTVAKLAAHPRVFAGATVGILNLDTYRVGAAEQIGHYGTLSDVPVASAHTPADLISARRQLRACRVVLVDCPGRGPRLHSDTANVGEMLDLLRPSERHLVMPVGTQPALVRRTVEHFAAFGITHLLATKVDEMPDDWILFDVAADLGLPMRWLADGQTVPQDLRSASARLDAAAARRRLRVQPAIEVVA